MAIRKEVIENPARREALRQAQPEDPLPEHYRYRDEGCELAPSCLRCPFPACKYDDPAAWHNALRERRNRELRRLRRNGWSIGDLAERYGLSKRSVHRILANGRRHHELEE